VLVGLVMVMVTLSTRLILILVLVALVMVTKVLSTRLILMCLLVGLMYWVVEKAMSEI